MDTEVEWRSSLSCNAFNEWPIFFQKKPCLDLRVIVLVSGPNNYKNWIDYNLSNSWL